ncbi:putative aldouronate transport system permease protein [Paenibacillus sp. UNCCL117]|uniref:ABC transporter permease n=1 Tax=unclassified Paenibacillus TaxID=185978 RepID=UPI00088077E6|nr:MULTISPECIES: ABC transporter permease subunit [unclassified Paenibacillus]SDC63702.1 putative aldouronate transport system permease protein [Paenibacillus sp. cl123]SFW22356.1 putative aldouronate transport system permease protein [Paenibacillus sp. UNCCL117]
MQLAASKSEFLKKWSRSKYLLLLFLPTLLYYILFKYVPMFGIIVSFKDYNLFKGIWESSWVGLKYFRMFFESPDAFKLIRNTFLLGVYKLIFGFPAPIILALLLNEVRQMAFKKFVQTVSYLPHFISNVVVVSMLVLFLSPSSGIVNHLMEWMGLEPVNFMANEKMFRSIYVLSEIWQHVGWETIIYLAALTSIDPQLYEAAKMDGAGRWKQMTQVTLPGIRPAIIIVLILNVGSVLEIGFEKVFLMLNPAIYGTADILSTFVYRTGIEKGNYSYATAIDLFTSLINLIFILTANWVSRRTSETSLW